MAQTDERYYATYCRLDLRSEELEAHVGSSSVIVGTDLTFTREDYVNERGKERCRGILTNVRGDVVGYLPETCARRVCDLHSAGWIVRVAAWGLAYNKTDKEYLVDAAVIAYEPQYAEYLGAFADGVFYRMGKGERPDIKLGGKSLDEALANKDYCKKVRGTGYPKGKKDEAYYKTGHTFAEDMAVEGSKGNPGCWVGTILFYVVLIGIIAAAVWFFFLR